MVCVCVWCTCCTEALLGCLLAFDASFRPTAEDALQGPLFASLYQHRDTLGDCAGLCADEWAFESQTLSEPELRDLLVNAIM